MSSDSVTPDDLLGTEPEPEEQPSAPVAERPAAPARESQPPPVSERTPFDVEDDEALEEPEPAQPAAKADTERPAPDPRDAELAELREQNREIREQVARITRAFSPEPPAQTGPKLSERDQKVRDHLLTTVFPELKYYIENKEHIDQAVAAAREIPHLRRDNDEYWQVQADRTLSKVLDGYAKARFGDKGTAEQLDADDRLFVDAAFRTYVTSINPRTRQPLHPDRVARYMQGDPTLVQEFVDKFEGRRQANAAREKAADTVRRFGSAQRMPRVVQSSAPAARGPKPKDPETLDDAVNDAWKTVTARGA